MTGFMLLMISIGVFLLVVLAIVFGVKEDSDKEAEKIEKDKSN
jgi:hypothetical protein